MSGGDVRAWLLRISRTAMLVALVAAGGNCGLGDGPPAPGTVRDGPCNCSASFSFGGGCACDNGLVCNYAKSSTPVCDPPNSDPNGTPCVEDDDCRSGHCVVGANTKVCCASDCVFQLECGLDGTCATDGSRCNFQSAGAACSILGARGSCLDDRTIVVSGPSCDGLGNCVPPGQRIACAPGYLCTDGDCATRCHDDSSCDTARTYRCDLSRQTCVSP